DEHFHKDSVRFEVMRQFGYYVTESSEHTSEYLPYFIKATHPELIERYRVPLDEYPRRCVNQIEKWRQMREELTNSVDLTHERTHEYASSIMDSIIHDRPYQLGGNVINNGLITNLPSDACVEVPCLVDGNGVQGTHVGALPLQCAAVNTTNINVQLLTIEAALTHKREHIYHAALLDPHTSSELTIDEIRSLVDELMEAHGDYLPKYR
ncbi:MAG: alpha-glucosidase/alpha-galactosidase, partial [Armatimonadetes bacterium CG_4_8_14_3_um_filter_58_9]